jgi:spermidine synthase
MAKPSRKAVATDTDKALFPWLLAVVFLAGAASLLYEVLWVRQLGLSLGSTAIASSVMLSAFLGGLALGSWYSGRRADTVASPLMTLAQLEVGAAVVGALSVPALTYAGHAYVLMASAAGDNSLVSLVLRAAFSLIVMLVPATIFGATFPMATVAAGRMVGMEAAAGGVSAASAFGSAAGAAAAGLFLEPAIGLAGSALVGASVNAIAAILAYVLSRRVGASSATKVAPRRATADSRRVG